MSYRALLAWIILPLVPLALGFGMLELVDGAESGLLADLVKMGLASPEVLAEALSASEREEIGTPYFDGQRHLRFFNAYLPYLAAVALHVVGCAAVTVLMFRQLRALPRPDRRAVAKVFAGMILLLALIGLLIRFGNASGALDLGYRHVCRVVNAADVAPHLLPVSCSAPELSLFAWVALVPLLTGLLAAALASAVTSAHFRRLPKKGVADELVHRSLEVNVAFKSAAFLLVTSILALVLFYRLPLALIADADAAALWSGYAQAITLFWGVLFTLTLVCVFGPGRLRLEAEVRQLKESNPAIEIPEALRVRAMRDQIGQALTALAPLLIGGAPSIFEAISGAV